jgi:Polyketide cyclase / dehydrase and lipid transport
MIKRVLLALAVVVAVLLAYAATKPDTFIVQRSALIAAPADKIFPLIQDLRAFNTWNPFARGDDNLKIEYQGAASGKGAAYTWQGEKSGAGRMEVTNTIANSKVSLKLDFSKPFEAHNLVDFDIKPQGNGSQVNWAMHGPMPYISKLMTIFFSMDQAVGGEFEKGLQNLKAKAEAR